MSTARQAGEASLPVRRATATSTDDVMRTSTSGIKLTYDEIPTDLAEALRRIVNRHDLREGSLPGAIAVTSPVPGAGVTTVSQALATVIAQESGRFVCWVDCSWLAGGNTGLDTGQPSLVDILGDHSKVSAAFRATGDLPQLVTLSPGPVSDVHRNRIVRSPEFEELLDILREEFDHVIFDLPPLLSYASALAVLRMADSSLLVVRHRAASMAQIRRAAEAMEPTPNLAIVLNRYKTAIPSGVRRLLGE